MQIKNYEKYISASYFHYARVTTSLYHYIRELFNNPESRCKNKSTNYLWTNLERCTNPLKQSIRSVTVSIDYVTVLSSLHPDSAHAKPKEERDSFDQN